MKSYTTSEEEPTDDSHVEEGAQKLLNGNMVARVVTPEASKSLKLGGEWVGDPQISNHSDHFSQKSTAMGHMILDETASRSLVSTKEDEDQARLKRRRTRQHQDVLQFLKKNMFNGFGSICTR